MKYATLSYLPSAVALVALTTSMASAHDPLSSANEAASVPDAANVDFRWDQKIPLRDGVHLSATVYTPRNQKAPAPCLAPALRLPKPAIRLPKNCHPAAKKPPAVSAPTPAG